MEAQLRNNDARHNETIKWLQAENKRLEMEKLNAISKCHAISTVIERNDFDKRSPCLRVIATVDGRLLDALQWGNDQYFIDAVGHHVGREAAHKIRQANAFRNNTLGEPVWRM